MIDELPDLENTANYRKFIRFALNRADSIGVSYTSDLSAFRESKWWEELGESVIWHEYDERGILMLRMGIDHPVYSWLKSKRNIFDFGGLGDTDNTEFLWDLCLYKDGREIFSSVTHERQLYISAELCDPYKKHIKENK